MNSQHSILNKNANTPEPVELGEGKAFIIEDWTDSFENAQTRRTKHLSSVLMPVSGQGCSDKRILSFEGGYKALAIWHLIIKVAAECPQRGLLVRSTGPLDYETMAIDLSLPEEDIREAFAILTHPKVGRIKTTECPQHLMVSGSLRKGRKQASHPKAVNVARQTTGPSFYVDHTLIAYADSSKQPLGFTTRRRCTDEFTAAQTDSQKFEEAKSAWKANQGALEHRSDTRQPLNPTSGFEKAIQMRKELERI